MPTLRKPRIVVAGSANTDLVAQVPRLPAPGETVQADAFATFHGGKGANQAVAAARLGARVDFIGRVGADEMGRKTRDQLRAEGVGVARLRRARGVHSGVALILVDRSGQNSIAVAPGANGRVSPGDILAARPLIARADVLLLQLEIPLETAAAAARLGRECGARVVLNPAPAQPLGEELLRAADVLTPNETELAQLAGCPVRDAASAFRAIERLRRRGARAVVATLGEQGAVGADESGRFEAPAFRVKAVDATAAGDVFNGALAVRLAQGAALAEAVRFASAAAAISVTRRGAQPSAPTAKETERFLKSRASG